MLVQWYEYDRIRNQRLPVLFPSKPHEISPEEQRVSLLWYQLPARGKPVSPKQIAKKSPYTAQEIKLIFKGWRSEVVWDEDKNITGFFGLSLNKTAHTLEVDGTTLYTWCAWDALFIPELIDKRVVVSSSCPVTKKRIELAISPSEIVKANPDTTVGSLINPEQDQIVENVIGGFCCHIHFFSSYSDSKTWVKRNPGNYVVSLA